MTGMSRRARRELYLNRNPRKYRKSRKRSCQKYRKANPHKVQEFNRRAWKRVKERKKKDPVYAERKRRLHAACKRRWRNKNKDKLSETNARYRQNLRDRMRKDPVFAEKVRQQRRVQQKLYLIKKENGNPKPTFDRRTVPGHTVQGLQPRVPSGSSGEVQGAGI